MMNTNRIYMISGMTCNNCVAKVQATLAPYAEVVDVSLNPPQVKLTNQKLDSIALNDILHSVGNYTIGTEVNPVSPELSDAIAPKSLATYKPLILVFAY